MTNTKPIALITGASVGIGEAIARELAANHYDLVLMARRENKLVALAEEFKQAHQTQSHVIAVDVNDHEKVAAEIAALPDAFSNVEVLVNNAGLALGTEPAHEAKWQDWLLMIQTNCTALAYLSHLLVPGMIERKRGHVINIGSIAGNYAYRGGNVYGATKAFVDQFSANLRTDVLGTPVRVTNLIPGLLEGTEFSVVRMHGDQQKADSVYEGLEALQAEDVAEAVRWVVSLPRRVNINRLELMAISQSAGGFAFKAIED